MIPPLCRGCRVRHEKDVPCPDGTMWFGGRLRCRICDYVFVTVAPYDPEIGPENFVCVRCDSYAADPEELEE